MAGTIQSRARDFGTSELERATESVGLEEIPLVLRLTSILYAVGDKFRDAIQFGETSEIVGKIDETDGAMRGLRLPTPFQQEAYRRGVDLRNASKIHRHATVELPRPRFEQRRD